MLVLLLQTLRTTAVLLAAAVAAKFHKFTARPETTPTILTEEKIHQNQEQEKEKSDDQSELLDSNLGAVESLSLKLLLQWEMEAGKDGEALEIVKKLVSAQPEETEWKFLMVRMLSEMGSTRDARDVLEEILKLNPLDFEALFENALLMDRCGEREAVVLQLEEALMFMEDGNKVSEARDVRLITAQIQFLQKNVDEALRRYEELEREDPNDSRPYFCKGMTYSLLDRNEEAREEFAKYWELSPKKVEVEGYLRLPLSRMKVFGANEEN